MAAEVFARHDALLAEEATLRGVDAAVGAATDARERALAELNRARTALAQNEAFACEQRDRIKLVGEHWFYGNTILQPQLWLRGGAQGKIDRAQAKLDTAESERPALAESVCRIESELPALQAEEVRQRGALAHLRSVEAERAGIFDRVVAANPSQVLLSLEAQQKTLQQSIAFEAANAEAVRQIAALCEESSMIAFGHNDIVTDNVYFQRGGALGR